MRGRVLSKSNQLLLGGGLLTLSHGGIVYAVTQEEWKVNPSTYWANPSPAAGNAMLKKKKKEKEAGEQFNQVINLKKTSRPRWGPASLNLSGFPLQG